MANGYVYVLSNPAMPGLVKVGRSINGGEDRAKAIFQTGVPEQFVLEFEIFAQHHGVVEYAAHSRLARYRANPKREFFKCSVAQAIEAVLSAFLDESLGTGASLVDEHAYHAGISLQELAVRHQIHWLDIFECVPHLSEFAVRKAVDEYLAAQAKRLAELAKNTGSDAAN